MSQTLSPASSVDSPAGPRLRTPTPPEQAVIARIAAQRARIYQRRAERAQHRAVLRTKQGLPPDASSALRAVAFAKQHPLALAAVAGVAVAAGPKRLMRWAGVVLPLLLRLRAQR